MPVFSGFGYRECGFSDVSPVIFLPIKSSGELSSIFLVDLTSRSLSDANLFRDLRVTLLILRVDIIRYKLTSIQGSIEIEIISVISKNERLGRDLNMGNLNHEYWIHMNEIKGRIRAMGTLLLRRTYKPMRTEQLSLTEYDQFWDNFWDTREYFRRDLQFLRNGVPINPNISPFGYKKNAIIPLIANKIHMYNIRSVLEIGSGAGLNLMLLAPLFPDVEFIGLEPTNSGG